MTLGYWWDTTLIWISKALPALPGKLFFVSGFFESWVRTYATNLLPKSLLRQKMACVQCDTWVGTAHGPNLNVVLWLPSGRPTAGDIAPVSWKWTNLCIKWVETLPRFFMFFLENRVGGTGKNSPIFMSFSMEKAKPLHRPIRWCWTWYCWCWWQCWCWWRCWCWWKSSWKPAQVSVLRSMSFRKWKENDEGRS